MWTPVTGKKKEQAEAFYDELLSTLIKKNFLLWLVEVLFFMEYIGIERDTGDIDIKILYEDRIEI